MIDYILIAFLTYIGIVIGYWMGNKSAQKEWQAKATETIHKYQDIIEKPKLKVGPIKRPTAEQLYQRHEDPKTIAAKKAMKEDMDSVPELVELRKKANANKEM